MAGETDDGKGNLDFISLGMIPETEPERNAPENALDIPLQRQTGRGRFDPVLRQRRIRRGTVKRRSQNASKLGSRYKRDGSVIEEWRPQLEETGTPWFEPTPPSLPIKFQSVYYPWSRLVMSFFLTRTRLDYFSASTSGSSHKNLRTLSAEIWLSG
jgi:hypothetical protein